jgi:hypothetical protein
MLPGSWVFVGTLVIATLIGALLKGARVRLTVALLLLVPVFSLHWLLAALEAGGGAMATVGLTFIAVTAAVFGLALGLSARTVLHAIRIKHTSLASVGTLAVVVLDVLLVIYVP